MLNILQKRKLESILDIPFQWVQKISQAASLNIFSVIIRIGVSI